MDARLRWAGVHNKSGHCSTSMVWLLFLRWGGRCMGPELPYSTMWEWDGQRGGFHFKNQLLSIQPFWHGLRVWQTEKRNRIIALASYVSRVNSYKTKKLTIYSFTREELCFAVERVWQMSNSCYTIPTTINTTKLILCVSVITVGHFCGPLVQLKRQLIAAIGKTNKYGRADKTEPH